MTQPRQRHRCLVKEMKTLYMSVNHAAGMWAEPPQRVEQLMVLPAGLCLWSGCLSGLSVVVLRPDWPSCLLVGLWWATQSFMSSYWGYWATGSQRGAPYLCYPLYCIFSLMYTVPYEVIFSCQQEHLTYYSFIHLSQGKYHIWSELREYHSLSFCAWPIKEIFWFRLSSMKDWCKTALVWGSITAGGMWVHSPAQAPLDRASYL